MKTVELIGTSLDWAVAKCENFDTRNNYRVWFRGDGGIIFDCCADDWEHAYEQAMDAYPNETPSSVEPLEEYTPSTNWSQGGPIIERERIELKPVYAGWAAFLGNDFFSVASSALVAAMRCYVSSKLKSNVTIPEELK